MKHYLKTEVKLEEIINTKRGKKDTIYVQFATKDQAIEVLRRGGIAKSKNPEIKVTNYIPPQIFNRYRAAEYVAELRESSEEGMYTVRVSKTDVRILFKKEINEV